MKTAISAIRTQLAQSNNTRKASLNVNLWHAWNCRNSNERDRRCFANKLNVVWIDWPFHPKTNTGYRGSDSPGLQLRHSVG